MDIHIIYFSSQGFENIEDTISMFSKDKGPLSFKLLEVNHSSEYYQFYRDLRKISKNNLQNLSKQIRVSHNIHSDDLVVIVSPKSLETPTEKFNGSKDWYSYYYERAIVVKTGGWEKITEGNPYLGISHQIIENVLDKLGNVDKVYLTGDLALGKNNPFVDLVIVGDIDKTYLYQLIGKAETLIDKKIRVGLYLPEEFTEEKLKDVGVFMKLMG